VKLARVTSKKARIEIIPLIDTVFFLLVFFMMSSLSMTVYRGLSVDLPKAATGQAQVPDETAAVTVDRDGRTFLNKRPLEPAAITAELRAQVASRPDLLVVLSADEAVAHGRVVEAMDAVRAAGVGRLAVAVKPGSPGR
jgi:biopolymer transport protein ExbD